VLIQDTLNYNRFCTASVNARVSQRNYVKKQKRCVTEMLYVDMKTVVYIYNPEFRKRILQFGLKLQQLRDLKTYKF